MAFDFPAAPAVDDEYTIGGINYIWTGEVWEIKGGGDLADYVLKAGDEMSGPLEFVRTTGTKSMSVRDDGSNATRVGVIEFFNADGTRRGYVGAGDADTHLNLRAENGAKWALQGGVYMQGGLGIHWANDSAVTGQHDLSKSICLYGHGSTSQFGFNITSGTLNYIVQNNGNKHNFIVGTANKLQINSAGVTQPTVADNANGYFIGDRFHGMYFHGGTKLIFTEYHDNFEWRRQTSGTGAGGDLRMSLVGGVLGPATNYNVSWLNGFSGTCQFRVTPAGVSLHMVGVSKNSAENGTNGHSFKMCALPSGVPAPWATLIQPIHTCYSGAYVADNRKVCIKVMSDGVWFQLYDGGVDFDYLANAKFDCCFSWVR